MSDENISVEIPAEKPKKVKAKKIAKGEKKAKKKGTKAAKPKKGTSTKRTKIDTSGPRKDVKIAASLYATMADFADKHELASVGHAVDKFVAIGITRKKALDKYAKTQK